jgi:hypothetical protein
MEIERLFNTFLEQSFNATPGTIRVVRRVASVQAGFRGGSCVVRNRCEGDLLRTGDAPLGGSPVHAEEGGQPHAVLDDDNIGGPIPACLPREIRDRIGHQCGEPVQVPVERGGVDLGVILVGPGQGPQVQAQ